MSASALRCPDCNAPIQVGIQPEDGSYYLYCSAVMCSPLLVSNLVKAPLPEPKRKKRRRK